MNLYTVNYRTRLEGWEQSVHILADSPYKAYRQVADWESRPIPIYVSLTNEIDYVK
jgi:hypothetical protein